MKKLALILITILSVFSCGDDVEFNTPAIQGNKDGNLWRAKYYSADIDFGGFLIEGGNNIETVQLVTLYDSPGTYSLGDDSASVGIFRDALGIVYSTANAPDPSVSVYPSDGQIIIQSVNNNTTPKTITGTFWFNAYSADGLQTVNFNEGVFYKIPLIGGLVALNNGSSCLQATQQTAIAESAYNATDITMPNYTDICNAYKDALINKRTACGDVSGNIQSIIDSLGTCVP